VLVRVKNKCKRSFLVRPPGVEKTNRLGSKDPVASGVKCGLHGGKYSKMKSRTVSWLSHKTKVKSGLHGSQVMSGDWRRLHQVRGVCGGSPENHRVTRLSHKAKAEDQAWLSGQNRPDWFGEPILPVWGRRVPEASRRRTRVRIARLASRLRKVRSPGIRLMVLQRQFSKVPLVGVYPSLGFRGILVFRLCLHITKVVRGWQPSLGTLPHFVFLFSLPIFIRISIGLA
jgi:hypothetical protein